MNKEITIKIEEANMYNFRPPMFNLSIFIDEKDIPMFKYELNNLITHNKRFVTYD